MGSIDGAALDGLRKRFTGQVHLPGDPGYDETRTLFNSMIDRRPAIATWPANADDVVAAILFAREQGLDISIRSGGHGVAGAALADGGLVIDTRLMNQVTVDPARKTARVGGGARWSDFDGATQQHGLGSTGGRVSSTGVAGLTLGGGSGWIERKYGLACDSLASVDVVTADGSRVTASATENPDLFWALHGGGGNFGVATSFEFSLQPLGPEILAAIVLYQPDQGPEVLRNYRDFAETAPEELGGGFAFITGPPAEFVPEHIQGQIVAGVIITWTGEMEAGRQAIKPLVEFGKPEGMVTMPIPYTMFQSMLDDPPGFRNYWSAEYLHELPDTAIDAFCKHGMNQKVSPTQLIMLPWGAAVARVGEDETPMTQRNAAWVCHPLALWESAGDDREVIGWVKAIQADMRPYASGATYLNFIGDEGEDRIVAAFGREKYDRLAEIKGRFDPDNVFRYNQNIKPKRAS